MKKEFDQWNNRKKTIDYNKRFILPKKKEVWWSSIGVNIGSEEDGKNKEFERPVLVVKAFNEEVFLGIPITSSSKFNKKYYFSVSLNNKNCFLILSQIRLFSTKRLSRKIGSIANEEFAEMKKVLGKVIGL
jgi:mRNA interferase MazF